MFAISNVGDTDMTNEQKILTDFKQRLEKRCIDGGIYPAFVQRQLEKVIEEMTVPKEKRT